MPEPRSCRKCRKNPSTTQFTTGGALDLSHGFYSWWCDVCVLTQQLQHARARAKAIPELERKLKNAKAKARRREARREGNEP